MRKEPDARALDHQRAAVSTAADQHVAMTTDPSPIETVVPPGEWPSALAQVSCVHHGEHVTVELLDGRSQHTTVVHDASLRSIVPDGRDAMFVTFLPRATARDAEPMSIVGPTRLALHRAHDGTHGGVDVATRDGRRYRLRFGGRRGLQAA